MIALLVAPLLACAEGPALISAGTPAPIVEVAPAPKTARPTPTVTPGERAAWTEVDGIIHVNNRLCAVSHSPLAPDQLGTFTSTVAYHGSDTRFSGRKLVFNQCCAMCRERFVSNWEADAEQILRFHGLK